MPRDLLTRSSQLELMVYRETHMEERERECSENTHAREREREDSVHVRTYGKRTGQRDRECRCEAS